MVMVVVGGGVRGVGGRVSERERERQRQRQRHRERQRDRRERNKERGCGGLRSVGG